MSNIQFKLDQVREHFPQFKAAIVDGRLMVDYSPLESMHFKNSVPLGMVLAEIEQEAQKLKEACKPVKLRGFNMSKGDLMKLVLSEAEQNYCDSAIPMSLWESCNTSLCVYDCKNNELVNLADRLISSGKLSEILEELKETKYMLKGMRKKYGSADSTTDLIIASF